MTELDWFSCAEPRLMLDHVRNSASPRQFRCIACACARAVWPLLHDPRSRQAVEVAERHAFGQASLAELAEAELIAYEVSRLADFRVTVSQPAWAATRAATRAANLDPYSAASGALFLSAMSLAPWQFDAGGAVLHHGLPDTRHEVRRGQCDVIREIIGNPFHRARLDPAWLTWNDHTVVRLAQAIHDEQRFDDLPILADALEEAGCSRADFLAHGRRRGGHLRGCWLVDAVLSLS